MLARRACGGGDSGGGAPRGRRRDHAQPRQRARGDDDRLEELHRAAGARPDLRPGPARPRATTSRPRWTSATRTSPTPRSSAARSTPTRSTPARRCCRSSARRPPAAEGPPAGLRGGQGRLRQGAAGGASADAVHVVQRGRGVQGDRRPLGLTTISDLAPAAKDLTLYGSPECRRRARLPARASSRSTACASRASCRSTIPHRHDVLRSGRDNVSIVFTTDPQIKRNGEVLLEDDKGMFPPYNSTLVVRQNVADARRPGPREDGRPDQRAADRRNDAGAQRARRPRPRGPGQGGEGLPARQGGS